MAMRQKLKYNTDALFTFRKELGISQGDLANMIGSTRTQIARQENGGAKISGSSKTRLGFIAQKLEESLKKEMPYETLALTYLEEERQKTLKALIKKYRKELNDLVFMQEDKQAFFEKTLRQYKKTLHLLEILKGEVEEVVYHNLVTSSRETGERLQQFSPAKQMKVAFRILQLRTSLEWAEKQLDVIDWMNTPRTL
jgi:transcriptional regulator with XRE-family HTH domain